MTTKVCFLCNRELDIDNFYKHPQMADGHVNKCKECNKKNVSDNYRKNIDHYVEYEKERFKNKERKAKQLDYQRKRRSLNKEKYVTNTATNNAIRDGRLIQQPCGICGKLKTEAHHTDYSKPLEVTWLCRKHHLEEHNKVSHE